MRIGPQVNAGHSRAHSGFDRESPEADLRPPPGHVRLGNRGWPRG